MSRLTRDGTAEPISRDQILRHARGQGNIIFPVQLTTSRIGNLTRVIHTLLYVMTIHTYSCLRGVVSIREHFQWNTRQSPSLKCNTVLTRVPLMYSMMPTAASQWMALGAVQYLATARTALAISGRVDTDSHIKLPTNSRNGQFSTFSFSLNSSSFTPTRSGTLCVEVTQNVFTNSSASIFWDIVRVSISRSRV